MRVGINALYLLPGAVGGTERYLRCLLRALGELDAANEYVVYTNRENHGTFALRAPRFREARCPVAATNRAARILWEQALLPRRARRDRLDVLFSPGYTAPLRTPCASVVMIYDVNYLVHPEAWSRVGLLAHRVLIPRVAHRVDRVLTCSDASLGRIRRELAVHESRISRVYLGVDGNLISTTPDDEREARRRFGLDGPYLLAVSGSYPHKNLDGLLRIYARVASAMPAPPPLVVAGVRGEHRGAARPGESAGRVVLAGWVDERELSALYRAARVFVYPSRYEGFGFPPLEAMSVGTPVVSSNAASLPEVVGDAGMLVDPADEATMAGAIRRVWDDEALRESLIERGLAQARQFTWGRTASETLEVLRRAVDERRARGASVGAAP